VGVSGRVVERTRRRCPGALTFPPSVAISEGRIDWEQAVDEWCEAAIANVDLCLRSPPNGRL